MERARFWGSEGSFEPSVQKDVEVGCDPDYFFVKDVMKVLTTKL